MSTTARRLNLIAITLILSLAAALATAFASVSTAWADSFDYFLSNPGKTIALPYFPGEPGDNHKTIMGDGQASSKVKNVKSSNKGVVTAKGYNNEYGAYIILRYKKAGKATLSYTYKGKSYKIKFVTTKYTNPLKSFKIGSTNVLSLFKSKSFGQTSIDAAGKLNVKAKKGWKITGMRKHTTSSSNVKIKNGSNIGTNTQMIFFDVQNKKTKVKVKIILNFEQAYS